MECVYKLVMLNFYKSFVREYIRHLAEGHVYPTPHVRSKKVSPSFPFLSLSLDRGPCSLSHCLESKIVQKTKVEDPKEGDLLSLRSSRPESGGGGKGHGAGPSLGEGRVTPGGEVPETTEPRLSHPPSTGGTHRFPSPRRVVECPEDYREFFKSNLCVSKSFSAILLPEWIRRVPGGRLRSRHGPGVSVDPGRRRGTERPPVLGGFPVTRDGPHPPV